MRNIVPTLKGQNSLRSVYSPSKPHYYTRENTMKGVRILTKELANVLKVSGSLSKESKGTAIDTSFCAPYNMNPHCPMIITLGGLRLI